MRLSVRRVWCVWGVGSSLCCVACVGVLGGGGGIFGTRDTMVLVVIGRLNVFQPLIRVLGNWQVMSRL